MKTKTRTLNLKQETLRTLDSADLAGANGGFVFPDLFGRRGLDAANAKLDAARAEYARVQRLAATLYCR